MILESPDISSKKSYTRIISLVPSQTELLYDLGLENEVIGITKFCVHPAKWYKNKLRIGGTKKVNNPLIKNLKPDLIIANKEENVKEQMEEVAQICDVFVTDVKNLKDAIKMINEVGILVGKTRQAQQIAKKVEKKFNKLQLEISSERKIRSAYLIWKNPFMTIGGDTFINNMMENSGFENIFSAEERYPEITLDDLKTNCELILLSSEPYPFRKKHLKEFRSQISTAKIFLVDGEMFSWYGSRLLKAPDYFIKLRKRLNLF